MTKRKPSATPLSYEELVAEVDRIDSDEKYIALIAHLRKDGAPAHPGMAWRGAGGEAAPPFPWIRESLLDLIDRRRYRHEDSPATLMIRNMIDSAERCYREGNVAEALLWVWDAGRTWVMWTEATAAKRLRRKRQAPPASGKANAEAAWTRAFNTHKPFRRWDAHAQADYLAANYSKDVTGITPETLAKYVRAFRKKAQ